MHKLPPRLLGRPAKLTQAFLQAAINENLAEIEQISARTFETWKARAVKGETPVAGSIEDQFLRLYKKALEERKKAIMVAFSTDTHWQRWAWILERKFSEWNLKHISQVDHTTGGESLNQLSDSALDAKIQQLLGN